MAVAIFGVFTFLTAYASSYESLLAMRFMAGLGLGGATPCFIALASEYAPKRRRAMVASLIWAAFPLGGITGGFLNSFILIHYGWQEIFYVGGVLPVIVTGVLLAWLPASLRYLLASGAESSGEWRRRVAHSQHRGQNTPRPDDRRRSRLGRGKS